MRNLWVQTEEAVATWVADLKPLRCRPEPLLGLVLHVLGMGERHHVLDVLEAPLLNYRSEHSGDLAPLLVKHYYEQRVVDLFGFTGAAMAPGLPRSSTAQATLAWYDAKNEVIEGPCTDPGALLEQLAPSPSAISSYYLQHYPPLRVTGHSLKYDPGTSSEPLNHPEDWPLTLSFAVHSDIWLPWVCGRAHPQSDYERMFDNRELARRHTPRLNAFLSLVGARVQELGGTWQLDWDESSGLYRPWLSDKGIDLEVEPEQQMPPEMLEGEWERD